jgi:hypothetical protein
MKKGVMIKTRGSSRREVLLLLPLLPLLPLLHLLHLETLIS